MSKINLDQIKIVDETGLAEDGSVIVSQRVGESRWSSNAKGSIIVPRGNTVPDRPTPAQPGHIRYNTDGNFFEGWDGSTWFRFANSRLPDGPGNTCAMPPLAFINSIDTGIASENPDELNIAAGGICAASFTPAGATIENELKINGNSPMELIWSVSGTNQSAIRHDTTLERFEFSGSFGNTAGSGTDASFFIDSTTKQVCFIEPVKFTNTLKFDDSGSGDNYTIGSTTGVDIVIDCENVDTTSLFRVIKHIGDPTGFSVNQDGIVNAGNGSVTTPAYSFASDTDTGWYYRTAPAISIVGSVGGTDSLVISSTYNASLRPLRLETGSASAPSLTFSSDLNTGIFSVGSDELGVTAGGTTRLRVNTQCVNAEVPVGIVNGSAAIPSIKFNTSGNTGLFLAAGGVIGFSANGTDAVHLTDQAMVMENGTAIHADVGSVATPSITFVGDTDTGIYRPADNTVAVVTNGADRVRVNDAETRVLNKLVLDGAICYGTSGGIETLGTTMISLASGQTNTALPAPFTYDGNLYEAVIIDYLVKRDVGISVGQLFVASDGTSVSIVDTSANVNNTGITFNATIAGGQVSINYTSTAGNSATLKCSIKRWGI